MKRPVPDPLMQLESLFHCGDGAPALDDKRRALAQLRENPDTAAMVDGMMFERLGMQHTALLEARKVQRKIEGLLDKFSSPPWFHGTFLTTNRLLQNVGQTFNLGKFALCFSFLFK